ncbi:MAG TPA: hypothetical protein VFT35_11145, partial [Gaiellaceae bacterium]|nr:hypothetical protein [Gaiellaceae bacterium]
VVVGHHELVAFGDPLAAGDGRHRWIGSQAVRRLVLLAFVLVFAAAGCGSGDDDAASGGDTTTATSSRC